MKKIILLNLALLLTLNTQSVFGWGQKGHDIVAYVAQCHLSKKASKAVHRALDGRSLVYYSSWMDNIRDLPEYRATKTWHYANVDEGETYETMKKEPKGDVYIALTTVLETLKNHKNISDSLETVSLKYLIHLVGDMHCPMHAGRLSDRGGNDLKIKWFKTPTNLHSVWDSSLIESCRKWSYTEWQQNIDYLSAEERKVIISGTLMDWLVETVNTCKQIYLGVEEGQNYSWSYMFENYPLLERQLRNAGYRLASLLNEIYK